MSVLFQNEQCHINSILELRECETHTDVVIRSDRKVGKSFLAHKFVLGAVSTHLKTILEEIHPCQSKCIIIPGVSDAVLEHFITFIYGGNVMCSSDDYIKLFHLMQCLDVVPQNYEVPVDVDYSASFTDPSDLLEPNKPFRSPTRSSPSEYPFQDQEIQRVPKLKPMHTQNGNVHMDLPLNESLSFSPIDLSNPLFLNGVMQYNKRKRQKPKRQEPAHIRAESISEQFSISSSVSIFPIRDGDDFQIHDSKYEKEAIIAAERKHKILSDKLIHNEDVNDFDDNGQIHANNQDDGVVDLMFSCPSCQACFSSLPYLEEHLDWHRRMKRPRTFQCSQCDFVTTSVGGIREHRLKMHENGEDKPFVCTVCGKGFQRSLNLSSHYKFVHVDTKRYKCDHCVYKTKKPSDLKKHILLHSKEKPHVCSFCGKNFTTISALKQHERTHPKTE